MTAGNHALTGAVIALSIQRPVLALPLAFLSHFVLDAVPHFGYPGHLGFGDALKHRLTLVVFAFDIVSWPVLAYVLVSGQLWIACIGAVVAVSPDFIWIYRFIFNEKLGKIEPSSSNALNRFHSNIQQWERPWGIAVEAAWFTVFFIILLGLLQ
jgi:hypothetical protein